MKFPIDKSAAHAFADDWISAWNAHDLDRVLSHYDDDFEMTSPFILRWMNDPSGTLRGKIAARAYWAVALQNVPDLRFELNDVLFGVSTVAIYYDAVMGKRAIEWFWFGESGKVRKAIAHYND